MERKYAGAGAGTASRPGAGTRPGAPKAQPLAENGQLNGLDRVPVPVGAGKCRPPWWNRWSWHPAGLITVIRGNLSIRI